MSMRMFVHQRNGYAAAVTVSGNGKVSVFRYANKLSDVDGPVDHVRNINVMMNARPLQGNVNEDLRLALEGAIRDMLEDKRKVGW